MVGSSGAVLFRKVLDMKLVYSTKDNILTRFQQTDCLVNTRKDQLRLCVVCSSPPSRWNRFKINKYSGESSTYLNQLATLLQEIFTASASILMTFVMPLCTCGHVQLVTQATHMDGDMLGAVITHGVSSLNRGPIVAVVPYVCSTMDNECGDHFSTERAMDYFKSQSTRKEVTFCKLHDVSLPDFIKNVPPSVLSTDSTTGDLAETCNSGFKVLREKCSSLQRKSRILMPNASWYTAKLEEARHNHQKAEQLWY